MIQWAIVIYFLFSLVVYVFFELRKIHFTSKLLKVAAYNFLFSFLLVFLVFSFLSKPTFTDLIMLLKTILLLLTLLLIFFFMGWLYYKAKNWIYPIYKNATHICPNCLQFSKVEISQASDHELICAYCESELCTQSFKIPVKEFYNKYPLSHLEKMLSDLNQSKIQFVKDGFGHKVYNKVTIKNVIRYYHKYFNI